MKHTFTSFIICFFVYIFIFFLFFISSVLILFFIFHSETFTSIEKWPFAFNFSTNCTFFSFFLFNFHCHLIKYSRLFDKVVSSLFFCYSLFLFLLSLFFFYYYFLFIYFRYYCYTFFYHWLIYCYHENLLCQKFWLTFLKLSKLK